MSSTAKYAVVVAGGSGQRMGAKIPKQFLELKGRPVLMHTVEAFYQYPEKIEIILVLPEEHTKSWEALCNRYNFNLPVTLQHGGASRFQSVKNGLSAIDGDGLVAIHDGVRPLIDTATIRRSFEIAQKHHSAVASVPLKDSIREMSENNSKSVDRSKFRIVQTPQTFKLSLIKQAYQQAQNDDFTDDASVWEAAGHTVRLFEGSEKNLKITTIRDLMVAEMLMSLS